MTTRREKHEERPVGYTAKMLMRDETRKARIELVNRWNNCARFIPRLRPE